MWDDQRVSIIQWYWITFASCSIC